MWNLIIGLADKALGYFVDTPEVKAEKIRLKNEIELARLNAEKEASIAKMKAEVDYDTKAQENMKTSWKDEYLILLHTLPIWGYIVPSEEFHKGLDKVWFQLENAPDWWWIVYIGIVASTFGLRWFFSKQMIDRAIGTGK